MFKCLSPAIAVITNQSTAHKRAFPLKPFRLHLMSPALSVAKVNSRPRNRQKLRKPTHQNNAQDEEQIRSSSSIKGRVTQ